MDTKRKLLNRRNDGITVEVNGKEVVETVMKLRNRKSPAGNSITNKILKHGGNTSTVQIKKLLKQIFLTSQVQEGWKITIVLHI
jgi:hypothetical protein